MRKRNLTTASVERSRHVGFTPDFGHRTATLRTDAWGQQETSNKEPTILPRLLLILVVQPATAPPPGSEHAPRFPPKRSVRTAGTTTSKRSGPTSIPPTTTDARGRCTGCQYQSTPPGREKPIRQTRPSSTSVASAARQPQHGVDRSHFRRSHLVEIGHNQDAVHNRDAKQ